MLTILSESEEHYLMVTYHISGKVDDYIYSTLASKDLRYFNSKRTYIPTVEEFKTQLQLITKEWESITYAPEEVPDMDVVLANNFHGHFNGQILKDYLTFKNIPFWTEFDGLEWIYLSDPTGLPKEEKYPLRLLSTLHLRHNQHYRYNNDFIAFLKNYDPNILRKKDGLRIVSVPSDGEYEIIRDKDGVEILRETTVRTWR